MIRALFPVILVLVGSLLMSCAGSADRERLRVFAASSLQDVLPTVLTGFEAAHPGLEISYQFAGSQALATQIEEGAPVDIFVSANADQVTRLVDAGRVSRAVPLIENRIVVAVPTESAIASLEDLGAPGVRIAIAAPDVPIGQLTQRALALLAPSLAEAIARNVITEDPNVRVALSRVELGEADAAFVYHTDLAAAPSARGIELPDALEAPANRYAVGALTGASVLAAAAVDYLLGAEAQHAFARAGFTPLGETTASVPVRAATVAP